MPRYIPPAVTAKLQAEAAKEMPEVPYTRRLKFPKYHFEKKRAITENELVFMKRALRVLDGLSWKQLRDVKFIMGVLGVHCAHDTHTRKLLNVLIEEVKYQSSPWESFGDSIRRRLERILKWDARYLKRLSYLKQ